MIYRVTHLTEYDYSAPVTLAHHLAHLTPRDLSRQRLRHHELCIEPQPAVLQERDDALGNHYAVFIIQQSHRQFRIKSVSDVEVQPRPDYAVEQTPSWELVRESLPGDLSPHGLDVYQYLFDSALVKCSRELADYAQESFATGRPLLAAALDLTRRIFEDFVFDPAATTVSTPLHDVLASRRGVCQDFAHLQIGCLRSMGLAARYVSGYIETDPAPEQEKLHGTDASHAWVSVYCPGMGWVDLDPTNNLLVSDRHITVAWGRDYGDVTPLRGVILGGGQHSLRVGVSVHRLAEDSTQQGLAQQQ